MQIGVFSICEFFLSHLRGTSSWMEKIQREILENTKALVKGGFS